MSGLSSRGSQQQGSGSGKCFGSLTGMQHRSLVLCLQGARIIPIDWLRCHSLGAPGRRKDVRKASLSMFSTMSESMAVVCMKQRDNAADGHGEISHMDG